MNTIEKLQKKLADRQKLQSALELRQKANALFDVTVSNGQYYIVINGFRVSASLFDDEPCHIVENMRYNYISNHAKH